MSLRVHIQEFRQPRWQGKVSHLRSAVVKNLLRAPPAR